MNELSVLFLGTSSGRPTQRRNVSGVLMHFGPTSLLFDCGEGTQTQVSRAGARISRVRAICITHFHGDHINGFPGLVGSMGLAGHRDPITVAAPKRMPQYLRTLRDCGILRPSMPLNVVDHNEPIVFEGPGFHIETVRLKHRVPTRGYIFVEHDLAGRFDLDAARALGVPAGPLYGVLQRGQDVTLDDGTVVHSSAVMGAARTGRKVAYISDTRPTDEVIAAVAGVDLLIHEATYLHEFRAQAKERGHSTVHEAATVAKEAGVKRLVLTHISPKHGSTSEILREARAVFPATDLAEDFSEFCVGVPQ